VLRKVLKLKWAGFRSRAIAAARAARP
jgi:hypothetical protein